MASKKNERIAQDVAPQDVAPQDVSVYDADASEMPPLTADGGYTVDGKPIPAFMAHAVLYEMTDQGRWERSQGKTKARAQVTRSEWDGMIEQRRDQPWAASDPIAEAIAVHGEPGYRYKALSPAVCEQRGMRGWEPLVGPKGDQVKIGNLFLGRMPQHVAEQRNAHYRNLGNEQLQNAEENLAIEQERVIRNAGAKGKGLSPLRAGSTLTDSRNPDSAAVIGFGTSRGDAAA